ncbi:hypothetical protein F5X68DRAFT_209423 [Plectosphaerella plurivora]|uniref:Uncharacterized protein n=1 Tax=Plectosphaerella plurivora TaxID=936078 RepID=A0A9P9ABP2_9PEZI|nr:hypothetical protein F5X68DRAFT_209423 [Plectosphaerella plurivora]
MPALSTPPSVSLPAMTCAPPHGHALRQLVASNGSHLHPSQRSHSIAAPVHGTIRICQPRVSILVSSQHVGWLSRPQTDQGARCQTESVTPEPTTISRVKGHLAFPQWLPPGCGRWNRRRATAVRPSPPTTKNVVLLVLVTRRLCNWFPLRGAPSVMAGRVRGGRRAGSRRALCLKKVVVVSATRPPPDTAGR